MAAQLKTRTKYLISFLSVFLVTVCTFLVTFRASSGVLRKNLYKQNEEALVHAEQLVTNRLQEALNLLNLIGGDSGIRNSLQLKNPIQKDYIGNALNLVSLQNTLSNFTATNSFVEQVVLYNRAEDFCVASNSIYLRVNDAPLSEKWGADSLTAALSDVLPELREESAMRLVERPGKRSYLLLSQGMSKLQPGCYAMVFINTSKLSRYFTNDAQNGNFYILSEDGMPLFASESFGKGDILPALLQQNDRFFYDEREYTVARTKSEFNRLTYLSVLPSDEVLGDMKSVEQNALFMLVISFVLVLCVSLLLTQLNYRPIKRLLKSIPFDGEETYSANEFAMIQEHYSGILKRSKASQEAISEYLRKSFFLELLNGGFQEDADLWNFVRSFHIPIEASSEDRFVVFLGKIDFPAQSDTRVSLSSFKKVQRLTQVQAEERLPGLLCAVETNFNHTVLLLNARHIDMDETGSAISAISAHIRREESAQICFAMSRPVKGLMQIHAGYSEAISLMDHAPNMGNKTLICSSGVRIRGGETVSFPPSLQLKLTNLVLSADASGVGEILDALYQKNVSQGLLSEVSMRMLYFSLCSCLADLAGRLSSLSAELEASIDACLDVTSDFSNHFPMLAACIRALPPLFAAQKGSVQNSINHSILEFVDGHLSDHALCLTLVAEEFRFSEPYVSTLIKELTGQSFLNYLTGRRISEALRLLQETDYSVSQVADRVGYNSDSSFRKAFKKATGENPSSYQGRRE